jgi:hypothetical protein
MLLTALVVLSTLAAAATAYTNRRFAPADADTDGCVVCGATDWDVVAPHARRCNRCGHESGSGWLALRVRNPTALSSTPPFGPLEDERMSFASLTDLTTDLVCAANEWMDDDASG